MTTRAQYLALVGGQPTESTVTHHGDPGSMNFRIHSRDIVTDGPYKGLTVSYDFIQSNINNWRNDGGEFTIDLDDQFPHLTGHSDLRNYVNALLFRALAMAHDPEQPWDIVVEAGLVNPAQGEKVHVWINLFDYWDPSINNPNSLALPVDMINFRIRTWFDPAVDWLLTEQQLFHQFLQSEYPATIMNTSRAVA